MYDVCMYYVYIRVYMLFMFFTIENEVKNIKNDVKKIKMNISFLIRESNWTGKFCRENQNRTGKFCGGNQNRTGKFCGGNQNRTGTGIFCGGHQNKHVFLVFTQRHSMILISSSKQICLFWVFLL